MDEKRDEEAYAKARFMAVRDVCEDHLVDVQRLTAEHYAAITGKALPEVWVEMS